MTRQEKFEERKIIAEYLKDHTIQETIEKFKISRYSIKQIRNEFNVAKFRQIHKGNKPNYQIIALIQNTNYSYTTIANKLNCTRQCVSLIARYMRDHNIKFEERD